MKHRGARRRWAIITAPSPARAVNTTINALQKLFLLRSCTDSFFAGATGPACFTRSSGAARLA
jgi:excinuclease ABC subunit C